jgi:hypothetical protein
MHKFSQSLFLAGYLLCSLCAPSSAQEKAPPARDNSSLTFPYFMAGIGILIVMVLVCMPARRE